MTAIAEKATTDKATYPAHPDFFAEQLRACRTFFERTTSVFTEEHAGYAPQEGRMTVAAQIAHVADTFDWFHDALLDMQGFDMDFEAMAKRVNSVKTLAEAREWFDRGHERLVAYVEASTPESMAVTLPENDPIMPGQSRAAILLAVIEHAAHHRGSLAIFARLAGLEPPMPYEN